MQMPPEKKEFLDKAYQQVHEIENQYIEGLITDGERYNKVIDVWTHTTAVNMPPVPIQKPGVMINQKIPHRKRPL